MSTSIELTTENIESSESHERRYPSKLPTAFTIPSTEGNEDLIDPTPNTTEKGQDTIGVAKHKRAESYMSDSGDSVISNSRRGSGKSGPRTKKRRMSTIDVLYQQEKAQLDEEDTTMMCQEKSIHPHSLFRMRWDIGIAICLAYNALLIPYRICFDQIAHPEEFIFWFDRIIDLLFLVDVGINFYTGYVRTSDGQVELQPYKVKLNYLKGWFWLDLPASIPWELVILAIFAGNSSLTTTTKTGESAQLLKSTKTLKVARYIRFVKLVKVLRLCRTANIVKRIQKVSRKLKKEYERDSYERVKSTQEILILPLLFVHTFTHICTRRSFFLLLSRHLLCVIIHC